jgi:hypothetical protein
MYVLNPTIAEKAVVTDAQYHLHLQAGSFLVETREDSAI